jgi:hypothetical protein
LKFQLISKYIPSIQYKHIFEARRLKQLEEAIAAKMNLLFWA